MGMVDDIHLLLTGADCFHDHHVLSHDIKDVDRVADGLGQAPQGAPGRQGPDENPRVFRMTLHADPVAQDGPAGEGAGRVNGQDAHGFILLAEGLHQAVHQRTLARSR